MSDLDKLFENAPEGAVELKETAETGYLRWFNEKGQAYGAYGWFPARDHFETIATRPQPHFKATRENLEKIAKDAKGVFVEIAKAKSEPEWTHEYCGERCKVQGEEDCFGRVVILTESGAYFLDNPSALKPIKPTITKAEAWDRTQVAGLTPQEVNERFTVK